MKNKTFNNNFFIFCIFFALAFLLFGNGINGDFVFDDRSVIIGNPLVEDFSGIFKAFLNPYHYTRPQSGLYRPLTFASFVLDWHLFSGNPTSFHVVNITLHALVSFLIFLIIFRLKNRLTAVIGSLLFLFLPIHVEAVTSIVGRGELLMFLFFLLSFYFVQKGSYIIAAAFFFLSLLSKETGISFIPVFIFFELVWRRTKIKDLLIRLSYLILPLIIYITLRYNALGDEYFMATNAYFFFNPIKTMDFFPGLWTAFKIFYLYVEKTVYPTYFSSDYSYNQITEVKNLFNSWQALAGVFIFIVMNFMSVFRKNSLIGLGAIIFLSSYLVISNLVIKTGTIMAERLMYMPSLGIIVIIAILLNCLLSKRGIIKKLVYAGLAVVLVIYGYLIIDRNRDWLSEKSLFESAYRNAPNSVVNMANMASIYFREGKNEEALKAVNKSLEIEPHNSPALHLAGQIYKKIGQDKIAEDFWQKGIQTQPDYLYPYLSLGVLYYQREDFKSGKNILLRANRIYNTPNVISLLAFNKIGLEEYQETIDLIKNNFGDKPKEFELRFVLGIAYLKSGNNSRAKDLLLELKDPALAEDKFFNNLVKTKIFNVEI